MNRSERMHEHPWPLKLVTWLVLGTQLVFPFQGQLLASATVVTMPAASSFPAPVLTPKNVVVNRTVPDVQPPSMDLQFSAVPTDAEISTAHVFKEPIVSVGRSLSPAENKDLARALMDFRSRQDSDDAGALENFLQAHPDSKWRISLLANLGSHYRQTMQFTKALAAWRETWALGKDNTDSDVKSIVDGAAAEMAHFLVTLGWADELQALLKELDGRPLRGAAYVWVNDARSALSQMQKRPNRTFTCGPFALFRVCASLGLKNPANLQSIRTELATTNGTSLTQNWLLSKRLGLNYQMAMRKRGAAIPLPCVVHWKQGHFSALTKMDNGRYLVEDGAFSQGWVTPKALDEEASGYFLIPAGPLPAGWDAVTEEEGQNAWGRSNPNNTDPDTTGDCTPTAGGGGGGDPKQPKNTNKGMPQYTISLLRVSLTVADVPLGYTPSIGPEVEFRISYNELDTHKTGPFLYSNLGNQWSCEWISYVLDDTTTTNADVKIVLTDGGAHSYNCASSGGGGGGCGGPPTFKIQMKSQGAMVKSSDTSYQVTYKDGSVAIFSHPENVVGVRRVFMTKSIDPQGNAITYTYDSNNRLVSVQDAIGQVTTLSYEKPGDSYKITKVTDPFGRYVTLQYNGSGQLTNITDVIGISSSLAYGNGGSEPDFINSFTTPYGTTTFTNGISSYGGYNNDNVRWLEATDPLGAKERVEFILGGGPDSVSANQIPTGMNTTNMNSWLSYRTTYFWDQKAMEQYQPGDYSKATRYIWLMSAANYETVGSILNAIIYPLENPVWYNYPDQSDGRTDGTINQPTAIGRVLDDGSTQLTQYQYNTNGKPTTAIDPIGRTTLYTYDTNNIDLLTVSQLAASATNTLAQLTYNSQHRPLTYVDASGQTTYLGYNTNGQLTALTNALNQVITLAYDTNCYLTNISGALPYAPLSVAYDGFGRVRTVTDSEGYTVTYDYDAMDLPTKVTYPDGTYEQLVYNNLEPVLSRDRMGRWTAATYDARRRLTAIVDALGRVTSFERCGCGALDSITDPLGRTTTFLRDVQKRVTTKIYPDGTQLNYAYENTTSRLKSVTDAKNQTTAYSYYNDNRLKQITYNNAVIATPSVSFTYDTNYNRLLSMTDGIGTTAYGYNPVNGQLGSGRLASVTNPLPNSVVTYNYDALGRTTNRAINGVAQTVALDGLGRVTIITNALGTFTNTYVGTTMLIATNFYPNGQKMVFGYHSVTNDQRLAEIWNQNYNGSTLSKFDYEYTPDGQIKTWTQQSDADTPTVQVMQYDPVNELLNATIHSGSEMGAILKQFMYGYDQAGNHTSTSMGTTAGISMTSADYNNANQMTSMTGGSGMMRFAGVLDKAGTVSVSGNTATMNSHSNFVGYASVTSGTNIIPIIASDYSSHSRTNNYQVVITNLVSSQTLQYDLNGNMTNDGAGITYEYNAADRTVAINRGANRTEFAYDGFGRRVQIVEKTNGVSVITNKYVWCETDLCEQRDNTGGTAVKRFFEQGEQISGTNYYFTSDYLGSIREVTDSGGAIRCRYDYDPYGVRTKTQGNMDADFGFTGHFMIASQPETTITLYRLYRTDLGRWLSRDPLGETVGLNVYAYVLNNPVNTIDPDGRCGPCIFAVAVLALGGLAVLGAYSAYNAWYKTDTIASAGNAAVTMENTGQYAVARDYRNQVIQNDIWGSGGAAKDISGAANGIVDFPTRFADIIPAVTAALLGLSSGSTPNSSQSPVNPNQPQPIFGLGSGYGDTHNMPGYITPRGGFYNGPTPPAGSKKNCP